MTDHAEEQEMEAEALAAIFDTHFAITGDANWTVEVYPETGADQVELETLNHVGCKLLIQLPPDYPESLPELSVEILKGLTEEHIVELERLAAEEAEANLGVPSIFAVAERLREWLAENNVKGLDDRSMHAQMMRKQEQDKKAAEKAQNAFESQKQETEMTEAEREELEVRKRRAEGTPCNKENFEAWKAQFLREMQDEQKAAADRDGDGSKTTKGKSKAKEVDKTGRITGFQYFSSKVDNLEALEAAAEEAAGQDFEDIDEELFDDDVDLDDLDFDDDEDDGEEEEEELDI